MNSTKDKTKQFGYLRKIPGLLFAKIANSMKWHFKNLIPRIGYGLYHFSLSLTIGAFKHSYLIPRSLRQKAARVLGDIAFLVLDLLKKTVWRMTGSDLQVLFVGSKQGSLDIWPLFFDDAATCEPAGEVFAWGLSRKTKQWLEEGCDLVICELSRLHPFWPKTSIAFAVPQWVSQLVDYPVQPGLLLTKDLPRSLRRQIKKCQEAGCKWHFSRSRSDFDYFYERLYLPFVRSRHGERAQIAPYPFQWDFWIEGAGGGLLLVTQGGKTVGGAVCLVVDKICYGIELGVLDANETLMKQGIYVYLLWCVAEWGQAQGAQFYNMGGAKAWRCNGSYQFKAKWKPRVTRRKWTTQQFIFAADRLPPLLKEKINACGFICEVDDGCYSLLLEKAGFNLPESALAEMVSSTQKEGLHGVCVLAPGSHPMPIKIKRKADPI